MFLFRGGQLYDKYQFSAHPRKTTGPAPGGWDRACSGRWMSNQRVDSHSAMAFISSSETPAMMPFMAAVWPLLRLPDLMSFIWL